MFLPPQGYSQPPKEESLAATNDGRYWRWITLVLVTGLIGAYLSMIISFGAGCTIGDGGFWLVSQRDAFEHFPRLPGSLTPLSDVVGGAWLRFTAGLGLYGARLGWVAVNVAAAAIVYASLSRWFPASRVAAAVLLATPLICHQQFTVLEYNNIPWFFLLSSALLSLRGQERGTPCLIATVCSVAAGCLLGAAVLSRLPLIPSLAIPGLVWLVGERDSQALRRAAICTSVGMLTLAAGLWWMWAGGGVADAVESYRATRSMGTKADGTVGFYSEWKFVSVYIENLLVGFEMLSVVLVSLCAWIASRAWIVHRFGSRWLRLSLLPLVFALLVALMAPVVAKGTFNPRFLNGLPFMAVVFCGVGCLFSSVNGSSHTRARVRQLCLLAACIPVLVMVGSNLGFYRMISASWLTFPFVIVLIPHVSVSIDDFFIKLFPKYENAITGASRQFLFGVVAALVVYGSTYAWKNGFDDGSLLNMRARSSHERLQFIRERTNAVTDLDRALAAVESVTAPGDTILAYPGLEMIYFLTDTRSPLPHMFTHESEDVIATALERNPPRTILYRFTPDALHWNLSESRRLVVERLLVDHDYEKTATFGPFTLFTLPDADVYR